MALRDVRVKEWGNRLVFRYDPATDTIELIERQRRVVIVLDDYRPVHLRRGIDGRDVVGVDFGRIDGDN